MGKLTTRIVGPFDWSFPDVALYVKYADKTRIWDVEIEYVVDPIEVWRSDYVDIWSVRTVNNGADDNSKPDPSIYIYYSDNLDIQYGYFQGSANGPGGDGEIACKNSDDLTMYGTQIVSSGASALYLVGCDDAIVEELNIYNAGEWGIDVVDGSNNFTAIENTVSNSYYGGAVFDEADNGSGTFTDNEFYDNNQSGQRSCQGINVIGSQSNVSLSGNVADPGPVACSY